MEKQDVIKAMRLFDYGARVTKDEAKDALNALGSEVLRLQDELRKARSDLESERLRVENNGREMLHEIEQLVRKYR